MKRLIGIIIFLFLLSDLYSQNQPIYSLQFADPKFLGGKVNCIFQDKAGFLWIGKDSGLFRYDGNELKTYVHDNANTSSIAGNVILSIAEDSNGSLWIGTKGFGLDKYDRSTEKFFHFVHNPSNPKSISHNEVYTIKPDGKGNFWIGTDGGGLNFFEPHLNKFTRFQYSPSNSVGLQSNKVLCISDAGDSNYWIGTFEGGLHFFDTKNRKFKHIGKGTSFSKINVFSICEVSKGILWLATWRQGLLSYNIKLDKFETVVDASISPKFRDIKKTDKGEIWASANNHLFYFPSSDADHRIVELPTDDYRDVWRIFIDYSKTIWFGCENGTLGKLIPRTDRFSVIPKQYPFYNAFPFAIVADDKRGSIYFASLKQIIEVAPKSNKYKVFNSQFEDIVDLAKMKNENFLLFASSYALGLFNKESGKFSKIEFDKKSKDIIEGKLIKSITTTDNGLSYWLGTDPHAIKIEYSEETKLWKVLEVIYSGIGQDISNSHNTTSYLYDNHNNFYIGTMGGGLNIRKKGQNKFIHFLQNKNNSTSISDNNVLCMLNYSKNHVLVGTNAGLNIFNSKLNTFKTYSTKEGLATQEINAIVLDKKKEYLVKLTKRNFINFK